MQIFRQCKDCSEWTHTVCCFMFGEFWNDKSSNGYGCAVPLDNVAESWRKAGWKPGGKPKARLRSHQAKKPMMSVPKYVQGMLKRQSAEPSPLTENDY
ncbi:MAG: hypothetical protein ACI4QT_05845 [Kiritimatiellia bacterium]